MLVHQRVPTLLCFIFMLLAILVKVRERPVQDRDPAAAGCCCSWREVSYIHQSTKSVIRYYLVHVQPQTKDLYTIWLYTIPIYRCFSH